MTNYIPLLSPVSGPDFSLQIETNPLSSCICWWRGHRGHKPEARGQSNIYVNSDISPQCSSHHSLTLQLYSYTSHCLEIHFQKVHPVPLGFCVISSLKKRGKERFLQPVNYAPTYAPSCDGVALRK